jgi:hypothetical protein
VCLHTHTYYVLTLIGTHSANNVGTHTHTHTQTHTCIFCVLFVYLLYEGGRHADDEDSVPYISIHTYIHTYIYIYICIYIKKIPYVYLLYKGGRHADDEDSETAGLDFLDNCN